MAGSTRDKKKIASKGTKHTAVGPPAVSMVPPMTPATPMGAPAPFPYVGRSARAKKTAPKLLVAGGEALTDGSALPVDPPGNAASTPAPKHDLVTNQVNANIVVSSSGKVTANNGLAVSAVGDRASANVSDGHVAQAEDVLLEGAGTGSSAARGKGGGAKRATKNDVTKGCPVSVITGQVVDEALDLVLPGPIPVAWRRLYSSAFHDEASPLGRGGWTHELHQWIAGVGAELVLRGEDGRNLVLPAPGAAGTAFHRGRRLAIRADEGDRYEVESLDTLVTRVFAPVVKGGPAMLRELRDRWGNRVELVYRGDRLAEVRAFGRALRLAHDEAGRIVRVEAWAAGGARQAVAYAYTRDGELASATDALGFAETYAYDPLHRITTITRKNGVAFQHVYDDALDRCVRTWGGPEPNELHDVELIYDLTARTTVTAEPEARRFTWNDQGALVREETPDGSYAIEYAYDADLLVVAQKNAAGETYRFAYDARGNRTSVTDPAGNVTRWDYDGDFPTRRIDPDGHVTAYAYDPRGALLELRTRAGVGYELTYDGFGQLVGVFGPEGPLAGFEYGELHDLVYEVDARRAAFRFTYDPLGRPLEQTDPLGHATRRELDALGRPVAVERADGTRIELGYDPLGNVVRHVDPSGLVTRMAYAGTGVIVRRELPDGQVWRFEYDGAERVTRIENPLHQTYEFRYDRAGRVEREKTFDDRFFEYRYGLNGLLNRIDRPDGTWRELAYDPLGNLTLDRSPHGPREFARDALGRLVEATVLEHGGKTVVQLERDALGRVVAEVQNGRRVHYELDAFGRRGARRLPDGETTRYTYDRAGALSAVDHDGYSLRLDRDALGRETRRHAARGILDVASRYDPMGRLVERDAVAPARAGQDAHAVLSRRTWSYDASGRVTGIADRRWGTTVYRYDDIGQLVEAHRGTLHELFDYDGAGALLHALRGLSREGQATWAVERALLAGSPDATYEYDENHRRRRAIGRADGAVTEYLWDCRDQLREVVLPSGERALYTYDALGRRTRKEIVPDAPAPRPGGAGPPQRVRVVAFIWDGNALAEEIDSERGKRVFVHEPSTIVPMLQQEHGEVFACVNDHLGMPKELVDAAGEVAWSAAHSAWGVVLESEVARARPGLRGSPFRLLGQYHDDETGLCYARFRYFDGEHGRWISPDPLGIAGGENLFGFDGSPTTEVDPFGLCSTGAVYQVPIRPGWRGQPDPSRSIDTRRFVDPYKSVNSRGFPRDNVQFWTLWASEHPETLSDVNLDLIGGTNPRTGLRQMPVSPTIDATWIRYFPEHESYFGEILIHHHVDEGPWAIPVPQSTHPGSGGPWHS